MEYDKEWKNCKKEFEKLTGKKKPAPKTLGMFRKGTGVAGAAKKVDAAFITMQTANGKGTMTKKEVDGYDKVVKSYKTAMESYIKDMGAALAKEKDADAAYGKAIIMMKKMLKGMFATMNSQGVIYANELKGLETKDKVIALIIPSMISSLKRMSAFAAKVEAQKTPEDGIETFNSGIVTATRDITQNLNNAMKFQKKDMVQWKGKDMNGAAKVLTAWANNGRTIPTDGGAAGLKRELGALKQVVQGAKQWMKANS